VIRYIENLDCEIERLLCREKEGIHMGNEQALHVLFENRKAALRMFEESGNQHEHLGMTKPSLRGG